MNFTPHELVTEFIKHICASLPLKTSYEFLSEGDVYPYKPLPYECAYIILPDYGLGIAGITVYTQRMRDREPMDIVVFYDGKPDFVGNICDPYIDNKVIDNIRMVISEFMCKYPSPSLWHNRDSDRPYGVPIDCLSW